MHENIITQNKDSLPKRRQIRIAVTDDGNLNVSAFLQHIEGNDTIEN